MSDTNWTPEYPTRPGFYWVRNIVWRSGRQAPKPNVVEVVASDLTPEMGLDFYFTGNEVNFCRGLLTSAEWQGPIQPEE